MFASLLFVFTVSSLIHAENSASSPRGQEDNYCLLPPYPEHGRYTHSRNPNAKPGEIYFSVKLDISCDTGYFNNNTVTSILCIDGTWSAAMPTCVRDLLGFCTLPTGDLKVEYRCLSFPGTLEKSWECESMVSSKTTVRPICRFPGYFSRKPLSDMHCRDGMWDYNPICKPACGLTTQHLKLEGTSSNHLELPWHAVIYKKWSKNYEQRCSGSLVTATKIISSANCFYKDKDVLFPASDFVVAVNKMYLPYKDPRDRNSQYSDVIDIKIPSSYRGSEKYFEDNISIVIVKKEFLFHLSVRPVCLDFDNNLDRTQLTEGNSGIAVRRYIDGIDADLSDVLNVVDFPYVKHKDCYNILPTRYRYYLTNDKFCTSYSNGTSFSLKNIGGGLAFLESTTQRYYLRGVISISLVNAESYTSFRISVIHTSIVKHENFIKEHL